MAQRLLQVFPDAGRVEHALLEASRAAPFVDATGYWTLGQLVEACAAIRVPVLSRLDARLLAAAAVRNLPDGPFGAWAHDAGFARAAVELIAQLEAQLATPDQLERAAATCGSSRAAFIARLWQRYRRLKAERSVADAADQLTAATAALRRGLPEPLQPFAAVELVALHDLTSARLAFVHALDFACRGAGKTLALHLPRADNAAIDALVNEVHADLERRHETSQVDLVGDVADVPFARLRLFVEGAEAVAAPGLTGFSASTPREEARELARRVRRLLDAGAAPEEIAVVFRELGPEADAVVEALAERHVPTRARLGTPLAATPAGHLALALPQLVDDGFPAAAVARCLASRHAARLWQPAVEPGVLFAQAGIRDDRLGADGQRGAYAVRLGALATRFTEGWPKGPADEVRSVARQVARLIEAASQLRAEDTLSSHVKAWGRAVEGIGLFEGLRGVDATDERALARDQATADALTALVRTLSEAAKGVTVRFSRRDFGRWLHDAADDFKLLQRGPRAGAVSLLEAREIHGRRFRHVFIGGLVDGRFPGRASGGGLLAEDEKGALNIAARAPLFRLNVGEAGARLPLRLAEDRLLFYLSLCAATETVTLSHPRGEALGRSFSPSMFLPEVARAVEGFEVKRVPRPLVPAADEVSNDAELRLRAMLDGAAIDGAWATEARALAEQEQQRLRFFSAEDSPAGPYTGDASAEDLVEFYAQHFSFDAERPLSAARLGAWGNCAYAGFLGEVLGLQPTDEQGEDVDGRSRGTLMHRVLELLLPVLREPPANIEDVVRLAVDEVAGSHERRSATGHPLLWGLARERVVAEVSALIRSGEGRPFSGLLPEKAEWKFEVALPGAVPVTLAGKIDRLDLGAGRAGIVDYKSRKEDTAEHVRRLLSREWQLPVYAYAVKAAGVADRVEAAWVSFRDGSRPLSDVTRDVGVTLDELVSTDPEVQARLEREGKPNLGNAVQGLVARMRSGDFAARPQDCEYCRFRAVCRISNRKLHDEGKP